VSHQPQHEWAVGLAGAVSINKERAR